MREVRFPLRTQPELSCWESPKQKSAQRGPEPGKGSSEKEACGASTSSMALNPALHRIMKTLSCSWEKVQGQGAPYQHMEHLQGLPILVVHEPPQQQPFLLVFILQPLQQNVQRISNSACKGLMHKSRPYHKTAWKGKPRWRADPMSEKSLFTDCGG